MAYQKGRIRSIKAKVATSSKPRKKQGFKKNKGLCTAERNKRTGEVRRV
jgi:hypothetical protein